MRNYIRTGQDGERPYTHHRGRKNRGSAVIEITWLMPIVLGIFYLYICYFLFLLESGKNLAVMTERLYQAEDEKTEQEQTMRIKEQGRTKSIYAEDASGMFEIDLELHRNDDSVVENIRRWQLATDTIHKRGNE